MPVPTNSSLIGGKLLAKNTAINILGIILPLIVASFTIPLLINGLGVDRFGVLSLAWVFTGYFNLFDLGLGRAVTQMISEKLGSEQIDDLPQIFWTSQLLMLIMGIIGMLIVLFFSETIAIDLFKIPLDLETETLSTIRILSIIIPLVTSTTGLRGYLQAYQRFDLVNYIRIPFGAFVFLGPLAVLPFSTDLAFIAITLAVGRFIVWVCYFITCIRISPILKQTFSVDKRIITSMLSYGGWMTVSNIVGPLMVYFDRFIVGGIVGTAAVAYYTVPQEIVTKIMLVPNSFMNVLFPAFAFASIKHDKHLLKLVHRSTTFNIFLVFPLVLILIGFAFEGLDLWLGQLFATNGYRPLQWLAVGTFFNAIGVVPYALLQGIGRPDATAKLHLLELPLYLGMVYFLTTRLGLTGTAIAWAVRLAVDAVGLLLVVYKLVPHLRNLVQSIFIAVLLSLLAFALLFLSLSISVKIYIIATILCGGALLGYQYAVDDEDRVIIQKLLKSFVNRYQLQ